MDTKIIGKPLKVFVATFMFQAKDRRTNISQCFEIVCAYTDESIRIPNEVSDQVTRLYYLGYDVPDNKGINVIDKREYEISIDDFKRYLPGVIVEVKENE